MLQQQLPSLSGGPALPPFPNFLIHHYYFIMSLIDNCYILDYEAKVMHQQDRNFSKSNQEEAVEITEAVVMGRGERKIVEGNLETWCIWKTGAAYLMCHVRNMEDQDQRMVYMFLEEVGEAL